MSGIRVLLPGLLTTVQDLGRRGYQEVGMPVSGAMDPFALQLANLLVGNERHQACLEITMLGPKLEFQVDTIIAITGADLSPRLNGEELQGYRSIPVERGSVLEFSGLKTGCRSYLSVYGGFDLPLVMGSHATYLRGKVGGFSGRRLEKDDILPLKKANINLSHYSSSWRFTQPDFPKEKQVRVVLGPQEDYFSDRGVTTFFSCPYEVTPLSDRMGYRLKGEKIEHKKGSDIISDGIPFGGIQIPQDGMPIILMADRQTTGGYAKIGTIITADLSLIAQSKPGDILNFSQISIEEAQKIFIELEQILQDLDRYKLKIE